MLPQVRKMAKAAMTEMEIADVLGIDRATFLDWQSRYPKFSRALDLGQAQSTKRVKRALFHRSVGYTHDAVKIFKGTDDQPVVVPYREHVPPDTNAAIFWLKNRQPDQWRDKIDIDGKIEIGLADAISQARARLKAPKTIEGE